MARVPGHDQPGRFRFVNSVKIDVVVDSILHKANQIPHRKNRAHRCEGAIQVKRPHVTRSCDDGVSDYVQSSLANRRSTCKLGFTTFKPPSRDLECQHDQENADQVVKMNCPTDNVGVYVSNRETDEKDQTDQKQTLKDC